MYEIKFVPGLGWDISSTLADRWTVKSPDRTIEKNFESVEDAILYLKNQYGENVKYIVQTDKAIRWPDD